MEKDEPTYFNPWGEIVTTKNRLPHWQQTAATYFVTWRLADSIPAEVLKQHYSDRQAWLKMNPEPWESSKEKEYHQKFSSNIDKWLDAGHGSCLLRKPENSVLVQNSILYFEGSRSHCIASVIMPNHVHVLFSLSIKHDLGKLIQSWKRSSAKSVNQREGTSGNLWQKDYFDRLIRDQNHFENCVRYIRNNPQKAHLKEGNYFLYESHSAKEIE